MMTIRKKPELLVTAKDVNEVKQLIDAGADAINVGHEKYGLRVAGNFSLEMIEQSVNIAHKKNVKIYVMMNALLHNEALIGIEDYVKAIVGFGIDGIVYGDPAVLVTVKEIAPSFPLQWNTETTSTNYETVNYWARKGSTRAILARELSFEEVVAIKNNVDIEVQVQVHGMTCIFHSKRTLVSDYLDHIGKTTDDLSKEGGLFLKEHKRPDEKYPVYEDIHGTHIMSDHDISMIEYLDKFIDAGIDSLKIEGIMHDTDYVVNVTKLYREAIDKAYDNQDVSEFVDKIMAIQPKNIPITTGFYFKEQYY